MAAAPGGSWGFLAITIVAFIILGTVLEGLPAIVLFGPLLFPVAKAVGVNEVHYAMVVILAMRIGLFAPPFGIGFFSACAIGRTNPATPCGGSASGRIPSRPVPRPATAVRTAEVAGTDRSQLHQFASARTWRIVRLGVREGRPPAVQCRQLAFRHQAAVRRRNASRLPAWISSPGSWWPTISSAMRPTSISASRSTPVSIPISSQSSTSSSVQMLPAALG